MPLSAVKPDHYEQLLTDKVNRTLNQTRTRLAPHKLPEPEVFASPATGFRMRAEFRVWHEGDQLDYVMFRPEEPKTPVPITAFPIACEPIQQLMPQLMDYLRPNVVLRRKLFQIEFLATLSGEVLISLIYHRPLDDEWQTAASALQMSLQANRQEALESAVQTSAQTSTFTSTQERVGPLSVIGRSRKQKLVLGQEFVTEQLHVGTRRFQFRQYEQSFTQPNAKVNECMLAWACARAAELPGGDLLELYCGNGNFTLPLSQHFDHVIATEVAKRAVRSAKENIHANDIRNVHLVRLSAEEVAQAMRGNRSFKRLGALPQPLQDFQLNTLFVDPPRAGLDELTLALAQQFERVIYISCNPDTLAENLAGLSDTHRVSHYAVFDQFPYTHHMESGVVLERR